MIISLGNIVDVLLICRESDHSGDKTVGEWAKKEGHKVQMYMIREGGPGWYEDCIKTTRCKIKWCGRVFTTNKSGMGATLTENPA